MLEDCKFLDPKIMGKCFDRVNDMLQRRQVSLTIHQEQMTYTMFKSATENLYRLSLGILNFNSQKEQEGVPIDDLVLRSCLGQIVFNTKDSITVLVDQLCCIKDLICRQEFCLNAKQISWVHHKFKSWSETRRELQYQEKKAAHMKRIEKEVHQDYPFQPKLHKRMPSRSPVMKKKQLGVSASTAREEENFELKNHHHLEYAQPEPQQVWTPQE